ncbi:uncharacterized protein LOC107643669 isoform X4 [Arachis ipaensis]|uniref:uncharacterized protein LOC107643669 isoform X4 n=1 Tax=Arachis ipaensis TaxID=130454 RepID=UPI000A2B42D8|nr:uncharacterized protein LOC107643669 isoform X4 [Arachis ipaensis]XP_025654713.1 uncharacterized protein LOC112750281 isoform X4 [Arachis hypogaea]
METLSSLFKISVTWRGKKFAVEMNSGATVKDLGQEMQKLTNVQEDTMRFIVPLSSGKNSKLLAPFSVEYACLSLLETAITEAKTIKMMGVSSNEVEEVLQNAKANFRIAGFEDEEKRMKQRVSHGSRFSLKLPQGPYIFCEFRTFEIPGIELNPPPSEALKRMHMLAADPGIIAVMNKHCWCVGIMSEMAPVGYVGKSPKCLLGLNKNQGEEISLRLRTDDLKGFRKYESIKKTLLHELLNQEAANLDWTRSASHTLSGVRNSEIHEEDFIGESSNVHQKLGGNRIDQLRSARESSISAAYLRMANVSLNKSGGSEVYQELDPDYSSVHASENLDHMISISKEIVANDMPILVEKGLSSEPDAHDHTIKGMKQEPDPDDSDHGETLHTQTSDMYSATMHVSREPDPDDSESSLKSVNASQDTSNMAEHDPGDLVFPTPSFSTMQIDEPDPDDQEFQRINDPVTAVCNRLQTALEILRGEATPMQTASIVQTLLKIVSNVIEHPEEMKYKRLRKANPVIERNIIGNKAALEILFLVGFSEDVIMDNLGKPEVYLVLKRNDPGLLWLAKSTLQSC